MTRCLLLLALACAPAPEPERSDDAGPEPTVAPEATPTPDSGLAALSVVAQPVTCADPGRRDEGPYDLVELPDEARVPRELMASGLVVADLDGDGRLDLLTPGVTTSRLFLQQAGRTFRDVSSRLEGFDLTDAVGGSAADIDDDGDLDVIVTRWRRPDVLLANRGDGHFDDVTDRSGIDGTATRSQSASWGDVDGDGVLDLFLGRYGPEGDDPLGAPTTDPSSLHLGRGDGTFRDASSWLSPELRIAYVFASGFQDVDADGRPELIVATDFSVTFPTLLLRREGDAMVVAPGFEVLSRAQDGMGVGIGDLDGDLLPDFVISAFREVGVWTSEAGAWWESGGALGVVADPYEPQRQVFGWGTEVADLDQDADLDAVVAWGDWTTFPFGKDQHDALYERQDDGSYADRAAAWGVADPGATRGVVVADLDRDGWPDLLTRVLEEPTRVRFARCGAADWLGLRLSMPPPNRHAVGAEVRVRTGARSQVRWVHAGSTSMYSSGPPEVLFGLGDAQTVDEVEIRWPDGERTTLTDLAASQWLHVIRR